MQSTRLHLASRCADYYVLNKDTSRVQYIDPGGLVRCTDAPPVRICNVYDIYELAEAENRAGKASDAVMVPNTVRGRPGRAGGLESCARALGDNP